MNHFILTATAVSAVKNSKIAKEPGIWMRFIEKINWDKIISLIISKTLILVLICFTFVVINSLGKKLIRKLILHTTKKEKKGSYIADGRIRTIYTLVNNIFHYTMLFFLIYALLSLFGIPVGTLIAGAGIASVALGLGAKGFVTDVVNGFFILLEQQFVVGDSVKIAGIEGTVHAIGLRTTQLISSDGTLHFIPNREITTVANMSRNPMRAVINIRIQPQTDIQKMTTIIEQVNQKLDPDDNQNIVSGPNIQGPVDVGKGELVYRVVIIAKNGAQAIIQREFLHAYLEALTKAGIKVPTSPIEFSTDQKE